MSALPPKADIAKRNCHVRFVPKADIAPTGHARVTPMKIIKRALDPLQSALKRTLLEVDRRPAPPIRSACLSRRTLPQIAIQSPIRTHD